MGKVIEFTTCLLLLFAVNLAHGELKIKFDQRAPQFAQVSVEGCGLQPSLVLYNESKANDKQATLPCTLTIQHGDRLLATVEVKDEAKFYIANALASNNICIDLYWYAKKGWFSEYHTLTVGLQPAAQRKCQVGADISHD
jgi:hypothetical protein